jgi:hypothetical protein
MSDIFSDIPDESFEDIVASLRIGDNFLIQIQSQVGYIRPAVFTRDSADWLGTAVENTQLNIKLVLQHIFDDVIYHLSLTSRPTLIKSKEPE